MPKRESPDEILRCDHQARLPVLVPLHVTHQDVGALGPHVRTSTQAWNPQVLAGHQVHAVPVGGEHCDVISSLVMERLPPVDVDLAHCGIGQIE